MRPGAETFAKGELYHLNTPQGSTSTAGDQVGKLWDLRVLMEGILISRA